MSGQGGRHPSLAPGMPGNGSRTGWHSRKPSTASNLGGYSDDVPNGNAMNGSARLPRHNASQSQQVRDAEEFELEGLMSEPETDDEMKGSPTDSGSGRKKEISA